MPPINRALLLLALFVCKPPFAYAAENRPNILIVLADDLGRADYSAFGTADIRTPHIDRLCREGATLDNLYANSCVCSPTRAALLTGCYPDRVGVPGVIRHVPADSWGYLSPRATLLPQVLHAAGYHSALVGKWHLGLASPNTPTERGFDHFHGFLGDMMDDYYTHLRGGQNFMRDGAELIQPEGHATDLFSDWACQYLVERAAAGGPFLLYLAYNAPHDPIQPPAEWLRRVEQREPQLSPKRAKLVALIEHLDDGLGRVLAALDRLKLADNTLVIFTSDNGGQLETGANNGPWRNGKGHMYDGGLRVVGAALWPGKIEAGGHVERTVLSMDLFATACEAAGAEPPADIDGVSFLPTLLGQRQPAAKRDHYFVRREGGPHHGGKTIEAVLDAPWKLVQDSPFAPPELYNVQLDPYEQTNLIKQEPEVFRRLEAQLRAHIQRGGQTAWQQAERADMR